MMTHHVGGDAREKILQKLVVQMQQRVFDVTLQRYVGISLVISKARLRQLQQQWSPRQARGTRRHHGNLPIL